MRTSSLSVLFDTVNRPPTGMPPGTAASGLLGLTDAASKAGAAGDWATSWDARPSITARHATTTLFISVTTGCYGGPHAISLAWGAPRGRSRSLQQVLWSVQASVPVVRPAPSSVMEGRRWHSDCHRAPTRASTYSCLSARCDR